MELYSDFLLYKPNTPLKTLFSKINEQYPENERDKIKQSYLELNTSIWKNKKQVFEAVEKLKRLTGTNLKKGSSHSFDCSQKNKIVGKDENTMNKDNKDNNNDNNENDSSCCDNNELQLLENNDCNDNKKNMDNRKKTKVKREDKNDCKFQIKFHDRNMDQLKVESIIPHSHAPKGNYIEYEYFNTNIKMPLHLVINYTKECFNYLINPKESKYRSIYCEESGLKQLLEKELHIYPLWNSSFKESEIKEFYEKHPHLEKKSYPIKTIKVKMKQFFIECVSKTLSAVDEHFEEIEQIKDQGVIGEKKSKSKINNKRKSKNSINITDNDINDPTDAINNNVINNEGVHRKKTKEDKLNYEISFKTRAKMKQLMESNSITNNDIIGNSKVSSDYYYCNSELCLNKMKRILYPIILSGVINTKAVYFREDSLYLMSAAKEVLKYSITPDTCLSFMLKEKLSQ